MVGEVKQYGADVKGCWAWKKMAIKITVKLSRVRGNDDKKLWKDCEGVRKDMNGRKAGGKERDNVALRMRSGNAMDKMQGNFCEKGCGWIKI